MPVEESDSMSFLRMLISLKNIADSMWCRGEKYVLMEQQLHLLFGIISKYVIFSVNIFGLIFSRIMNRWIVYREIARTQPNIRQMSLK